MATYIIGDVQGCFAELQALLELIQFNPARDRLGFVGDLVSRGPESLATLRFIKNLKNPLIVLGNHDLHCLALGFGVITRDDSHSLTPIVTAPDREELLHWLRQQPLLYLDHQQGFALVHAGIPPQWSSDKALQYAQEVQDLLRNEKYLELLKHMYGDTPKWNAELTGWDRYRYIINALTRMRFCAKNGELDVTNKTNVSSDPDKFEPWYEWITPELDIIFGHWAALSGQCHKEKFYALDTGCVWGGSLTALRIEDKKLFSVLSQQKLMSN